MKMLISTNPSVSTKPPRHPLIPPANTDQTSKDEKPNYPRFLRTFERNHEKACIYQQPCRIS